MQQYTKQDYDWKTAMTWCNRNYLRKYKLKKNSKTGKFESFEINMKENKTAS